MRSRAKGERADRGLEDELRALVRWGGSRRGGSRGSLDRSGTEPGRLEEAGPAGRAADGGARPGRPDGEARERGALDVRGLSRASTSACRLRARARASRKASRIDVTSSVALSTALRLLASVRLRRWDASSSAASAVSHRSLRPTPAGRVLYRRPCQAAHGRRARRGTHRSKSRSLCTTLSSRASASRSDRTRDSASPLAASASESNRRSCARKLVFSSRMRRSSTTTSPMRLVPRAPAETMQHSAVARGERRVGRGGGQRPSCATPATHPAPRPPGRPPAPPASAG